MKFHIKYLLNDQDKASNKCAAIYVKQENCLTLKFHPDDNPKTQGLFNEVEFWGDDGSNIKQLTLEYFQPYALFLDKQMCLWFGWPPDLGKDTKPDLVLKYEDIKLWTEIIYSPMTNEVFKTPTNIPISK